MTGVETQSVVKQFNVAGGGSFRVTASCAIGIVNFAFEYSGGRGGSKLAWEENETYSGTTFGFSTQLTRNVHRWVPLRIRLDQREVVARPSSSKYENETEVIFYDPAELQLQAKQHMTPGRAPPGGTQVFESLVYGLLPIFVPPAAAGTMSDLLNTATLRVEIPLADGRTPIVIINPDDPSLHAFVANCPGGPGGGTPPTGAFKGPSAGGSIEGTYAGRDGSLLTLSHGQATATHGLDKIPPMTYTVTGNTITMLGLNNRTLVLQVLADGTLGFPAGSGLSPLQRVR